MLFLKKLSIYIFALINLFLFYFILTQPEKIWHWSSLIVLILFLVIKFIIGKKLSWREIITFFSLILFLVLANILFLLIVENLYLKYLVIILADSLSIIFLELLFSYLHRPHRYQPFSIVHFFELSSLLTIFFVAIALFAFNIFLTLSFWWVTLILPVLFFVLICQNFWLNKFEIKKYLYYPIIFFIITFELTGLLTWLPISYYLKGFLITVFYFVFINLVNKNIKGSLEKGFVWKMAVASVVIVGIALFTGRWM